MAKPRWEFSVPSGAFFTVCVSLAVVFECGYVARVFVMFDDDSHGEGRTANVAALLTRVLLADEVAYLVTVDDVLGFLEASA